MTRLGASIGLIYGVAVIVVFLSVMTIWPRPPSPSLSVIAPSLTPFASLPMVSATATPRITNEPTVPAQLTSQPTPFSPPVVIPSLMPPTLPPIIVPTVPPLPSLPPIPSVFPTESPLLVVRGEATFYCLVGCLDGLYAAAGPELRAALPDWLGHKVTVWRGPRQVTVELISACGCSGNVLQLSATAFLVLAPLPLGVIDVEVRW